MKKTLALVLAALMLAAVLPMDQAGCAAPHRDPGSLSPIPGCLLSSLFHPGPWEASVDATFPMRLTLITLSL